MCGDRVYKLGGDAPLKLILSDLPWEGVPFLIELQTYDDKTVGNYTVTMTATLKDYLDVPPVKVEFNVQIKPNHAPMFKTELQSTITL